MIGKTPIIILLLGAAPAFAQEIGGAYKSTGDLPGGGKYSGTVEITMVADDTCRIRWNDGSEGICLLEGTLLTVAYLVHGELGLGRYTVAPDGSIEGVFIDDYHGGGVRPERTIGTELMTPAS